MAVLLLDTFCDTYMMIPRIQHLFAYEVGTPLCWIEAETDFQIVLDSATRVQYWT